MTSGTGRIGHCHCIRQTQRTKPQKIVWISWRMEEPNRRSISKKPCLPARSLRGEAMVRPGSWDSSHQPSSPRAMTKAASVRDGAGVSRRGRRGPKAEAFPSAAPPSLLRETLISPLAAYALMVAMTLSLHGPFSPRVFSQRPTIQDFLPASAASCSMT
jgi:hypothetical protein